MPIFDPTTNIYPRSVSPAVDEKCHKNVAIYSLCFAPPKCMYIFPIHISMFWANVAMQFHICTIYIAQFIRNIQYRCVARLIQLIDDFRVE